MDGWSDLICVYILMPRGAGFLVFGPLIQLGEEKRCFNWGMRTLSGGMGGFVENQHSVRREGKDKLSRPFDESFIRCRVVNVALIRMPGLIQSERLDSWWMGEEMTF
jgi:hypothetical protein